MSNKIRFTEWGIESPRYWALLAILGAVVAIVLATRFWLKMKGSKGRTIVTIDPQRDLLTVHHKPSWLIDFMSDLKPSMIERVTVATRQLIIERVSSSDSITDFIDEESLVLVLASGETRTIVRYDRDGRASDIGKRCVRIDPARSDHRDRSVRLDGR